MINCQDNSKLNELQTLPKVLLHEHLDCSLRPSTMLELWANDNFAHAPKDIPASVVETWSKKAHKNPLQDSDLANAGWQYHQHLHKCASTSLGSYLKAIDNHVLPLLQSQANLTRITRERIEDAVADGIVALELRFAPQFHTVLGLSLAQVMDAVIAGMIDSPIPTKLTLCAMRHHNQEFYAALAKLALQYKDFVSLIDLAGDEKSFPGVLPSWTDTFLPLRDHGIDLTIHLWETNELTEQDVERLNKYELIRIGHGIRGSRQNNYLLEICPTSNIVTGQYNSLAEHPVDSFYKQGRRVTINTDGTLFTCTNLTLEYQKLSEQFAWDIGHFSKINFTALEASSFSSRTKAEVASLLSSVYKSEQNSLANKIL